MAEPNELEAWREVHGKLLMACELAQEAVDEERRALRYWMEELAANLTEDGQRTANSVWTPPMLPKSAPKKKIVQLLKKRKRKPKPVASKKKRKQKVEPATQDDKEAGPTLASPPRKLRLKTKKKKKMAEKKAGTPSPRTKNKKTSDKSSISSSHQPELPSEQLGDPSTPPSEPYRVAQPSAPLPVQSLQVVGGTIPPQPLTFIGRNPLDMMAAVAFDAEPAYAPPPVQSLPRYSHSPSNNYMYLAPSASRATPHYSGDTTNNTQNGGTYQE